VDHGALCRKQRRLLVRDQRELHVFDIFSTNEKLLKHELLFGSGHFAYFENTPSAAGHCKWLARRTGTGSAVELLNFCKKDTSSVAI